MPKKKKVEIPEIVVEYAAYTKKVSNSLNTTGFVYEKNGELITDPPHSYVCYANFRYQHGHGANATHLDNIKYLTGYWAGMQYTNCKDYVDYIINRSPFSQVFLRKDAQESLDSGFIMSADFPCVYTLNACISLRYCHEHKSFITLWRKLVEVGVHEDAAWAFSHLLRPVGDGYGVPTLGKQLRVARHLGNHALFDYTTEKGMARFFNHDPILKNLKHPQPFSGGSSHNCRYVSWDECWTGGYSSSYKNDIKLHNLAKGSCTKDDWGYEEDARTIDIDTCAEPLNTYYKQLKEMDYAKA